MAHESWTITHPGKVRERNEDSLLALPQDGLFVLADGMGGMAGGDVASGMVVASLEQDAGRLRGLVAAYEADESGTTRRAVFAGLSEAFQRANLAVYERAQAEEELKGMGSTISALIFSEKAAFLAHAGDSRVYLLRDGELQQMTEDHTWGLELVREGKLTLDQLPTFRYRNVLVRSVGERATLQPDLLHIDTEPGDVFLICSDGLTDYASEQALRDTLVDKGPSDGSRRLVQLALEGGGGDNVSCVLVRVRAPAEEESAAARPLAFTLKVSFLRTLFLFRHLSGDETLKVLRHVQEVRLPAGEAVVRQGEPGREVYFIVEGMLDVSVDGVSVNVLGPGGHFGELSLVSAETRSATVTAETPVRLLRMEQEDFYEMSAHDPELAIKILWAFLNTLGQRLRQASGQLAEGAQPGKPGRRPGG